MPMSWYVAARMPPYHHWRSPAFVGGFYICTIVLLTAVKTVSLDVKSKIQSCFQCQALLEKFNPWQKCRMEKGRMASSSQSATLYPTPHFYSRYPFMAGWSFRAPRKLFMLDTEPVAFNSPTTSQHIC